MSSRLLADVTALGEVVRVSDLLRRGHSQASIRWALHCGALHRVKRGWVASAAASQDAITAVIHGGKLTAAAALSSRGTWDGVDRRLHLQFSPHYRVTEAALASPMSTFAQPRYPREAIVHHWAVERAPSSDEPAWRASVIDALICLGRQASADQFVACLDSALHHSTLSRAALPMLGDLLPARLRPLLTRCDASAASGLESLARFRLEPLVNQIRTQAPIPGIGSGGGVGYVDLLIDGWLVIELDGDEWHEPRADKARDSLLVRQGFRSQRFDYNQVIHRWASTEATVMELLRYPPRGIRRA
ncbi:MAG TPA: DUF559 domain-containing protein [Glaciihabitans sp.]|nr:DUF559 domain-containing protein [Glaciihabitans sp.]